MKSGKAAGPSGIVEEMLNASGESGIYLVTELAYSIVNDGVVPAAWEVSFILNSCKEKSDALELKAVRTCNESGWKDGRETSQR